jgi:uncharacterized protein YbaP (TraB family)
MRAVRPWAWLALVLAGLVAFPVRAFDTAGFDKGLLWKIERGGAAPSYVFGTIHSEDARVLALPRPVRQAFDGARVYVMEAVLDDAATMAMSTRMMFDDGRNLKQVLPPALYARTTAALAGYGMPEFALQLMKPWAVAMSLSMPKPETGLFLDLLLMQKAQEQNKPVAGLETVDEQLRIFDQMSMPDQVTLLEETLRYLPELDGMFAQLHEAYLARDLGALARLNEEQTLQGDHELGEKLMAQLLDARNRRMAQRLDAYFKQGNAFVAVGAMHLPGRAGVLRLLAQRGYRVTAVY